MGLTLAELMLALCPYTTCVVVGSEVRIEDDLLRPDMWTELWERHEIDGRTVLFVPPGMTI